MYRGDDILKIYDQDLNNIGRATREEDFIGMSKTFSLTSSL